MARRPINITLRTESGAAIVAAVVSVTVHATSGVATIYAAESGGSPLAGGQTTTGSNGAVTIWVDDDDYALLTMFDIAGTKLGFTIPVRTVNI